MPWVFNVAHGGPALYDTRTSYKVMGNPTCLNIPRLKVEDRPPAGTHRQGGSEEAN
jgi:hypothetical protein